MSGKSQDRKSESSRASSSLPQCFGIIALSSPSEQSRFEKGLAFLKSQGIRYKVALEPWQHYGSSKCLFSSDTPERRARALEELYRDKEVSVILSARGGYGAMEVLPLIDFDIIKKNRKPLVGFSDLTALLNVVGPFTGSPCIHGPALESAFCKAMDCAEAKRSALTLIEWLSQSDTDSALNPFADTKLEPLFKGGTAEGQIVGGNLSILTAMIGTKFAPSFAGSLLFLEEYKEKPYRVHRMLLQMKLAGLFSELRGVILGDFTKCESERPNDPSLKEVLLDIFKDLSVPVFCGLPVGHDKLNLPLPLARRAKIHDNVLELCPS